MLSCFSISPVLLATVVPVEVLAFGAAMLLIIVLLHGAGLDAIITRYKKRSEMLRKRGWHPRLATLVFAGAILLMLCLHLAESILWGLVLNKSGLIADLRDSFYFSANTYTTLGYGRMLLSYDWRELAPIMAISGLFTFAWTTSEMFNIVEYHHGLVADLAAIRERRNTDETPDSAPVMWC